MDLQFFAEAVITGCRTGKTNKQQVAAVKKKENYGKLLNWMTDEDKIKSTINRNWPYMSLNRNITIIATKHYEKNVKLSKYTVQEETDWQNKIGLWLKKYNKDWKNPKF